MCYSAQDHTFVICAYKQSQYLEKCIKSLINQTIHSNIIISTSTPCEHIFKIAQKYAIDVYINTGRKSIADDWNYGYSKANTALITIAHQDDIYRPNYLEEILRKANKSRKPLIIFTDYAELRGTYVQSHNKLLFLKRVLLWLFRFPIFQYSRFIRRRSLALGNGICCPSVTYVKPNLPDVIFQSGWKCDIDWQAWEKLSHLSGEFIFISKILMLHRIHDESETSNSIANNHRSEEDYQMFCMFWPKSVAKVLAKIYCKSEKLNKTV